MKSLFLTAALFSLLLAQSQSITRLDGSRLEATAIDQYVQQVMEAAHIQGLQLAILNQKKIAYVKAYGYRNQPLKQLADTATIVYGASFSKAVFAWLVMKLVEEKIIALDQPLYTYLSKPLPDYPYFADLKNDDRWKQITARMCLSHTTGLPNVRWFSPVNGEMDSLGVMRIYFTPGSRYAYSGEGFRLLQLVMEEITHRNVDELATEKVFLPLGMNRTGYTWHSSFGDENVAVGHLENGTIDNKKKRTEPVAGGSLVTTIADFARFVEQVLGEKGLQPASYREMLAPQIAIHSKKQFPPITTETTHENDAIGLSYGLGWGVFHCELGRAFFKEGNGGAWRNYNINFPDKGLAVIIMSNSENAESVFKPIIDKIVGPTCIPWTWEDYIPYYDRPKTK